ncbi:hypothetical protein [Glaciibacter psychrotolerans]|uniref:TadE family protein n=1 Tax=Glaciibacter psychrotolerans TaxID=670054 RepID=A0A7Z0EEP8_9MICO|nr:hypothetical protein [Leifsonia psychrotolerans]NYJ19604.1 hypothetical protein [Leifsonia psychrotolerans]
MLRWKVWTEPCRRAGSESGSASLEFITAGMILLVPLVYLVVTLSALQSGALAIEGAARHAARVFVQAPDETEARARALRAIEFGLADYGLDADDSTITIECDNPVAGCLKRQGIVRVTVRISIALPLVPDVLSLHDTARIPLEARASHTVSRFWGAQ